MENVNQDFSLLDIFKEDCDRYDSNLSAMSDFLTLSIDYLGHAFESKTMWDVAPLTDDIVGRLVPAVKAGYDISNANTLVADLDHFSEEITDGLQTGKYHIGQSKEISGNLRSAIVDENNLIVKQITLKRAVHPTAILSDISSMVLQASIQRITTMLDEIKLSVQILTNLSRRESLCIPFLNARTKVMQASIAPKEDQESFLKEADTYLMEGYNSLFADLNDQIRVLSTSPFYRKSISTVDNLLSFICEDMQLIPRYVGLQTYLFNYRGRFDETGRVMRDYTYKLRQLGEQRMGKKERTALEWVHRYYPYDDKNRDFWIDEPSKMLDALAGYTSLLNNKNTDILYLDMEDL